jgi:hypothetical protein
MDNVETTLLTADENSFVDGWCSGTLAGLECSLWPEEEPEGELPRVFLRVLLTRPVTVMVGDTPEFEDRRFFVLTQTTGDGSFHGEVAGFHAAATPVDERHWLLGLSLGERVNRQLRGSRCLHDELGGDV